MSGDFVESVYTTVDDLREAEYRADMLNRDHRSVSFGVVATRECAIEVATADRYVILKRTPVGQAAASG